MTVKDLIKNKDYDYIEWRVILPEKVGGGNVFSGLSKSENGKLISMDGDSYSENTKIIDYKEWSNPEKNIKNGLTITYKGNFV